MSHTGNKRPETIFGTFLCRFHILPALSEQNVPLSLLRISTQLNDHQTELKFQ